MSSWGLDQLQELLAWRFPGKQVTVYVDDGRIAVSVGRAMAFADEVASYALQGGDVDMTTFGALCFGSNVSGIVHQLVCVLASQLPGNRIGPEFLFCRGGICRWKRQAGILL